MNVASFIKIFAAIAWLAFFGLLIIVILRASRNKNIEGSVTIMSSGASNSPALPTQTPAPTPTS